MTIKIKTLLAMASAAMFLLTFSCKEQKETNTKNTPEQTETEAKQGKEYTSAYVCPMHCEGSGSEEEGNCPKCGMAYVANEEHSRDGHTH
jgi:uncharacterized paraquat-inducible protein A